MKRNEVYISPVLKEQMKKHQGVDALFRVIVELAITDEDYQEYKPTVSNEEALKALKKKEDAAWAAYDAALTELQGISDEDFRAALAEKITEKERQAREISRQYSKLSSEDQTAYYSSIVNNRLEYAHSVGAQKVMSITDSSDMVSYVASQGHAYFMALSQDMINGMANRGGYLFRLAPPERKEGYDPKVSDYLTNVLNGRPKDEVFHVAVVCAADRYNRFAWERNITVNREYNFAGFRPWQGAPSPAMSWKEYSASVAAYVNEVVERNGLIEKRVINPDVLDAYIDESVFNNYRYRDGSSPEYVNAITVGFEVNATKKEIMSLVKDEDVKVIYSMTFSLEDRSGISDNE